MSWSDAGWWIGVIVLLVLILIVLIVMCWIIGSALSKAKKALEHALCKFHVFEDRFMTGVEKWGEKAKPLIERGVQGLEARLQGSGLQKPLQIPLQRSSGLRSVGSRGSLLLS